MLAAEGARVVLAARRGEELERVAAGICRAAGVALPVVTDLADDDSMARLNFLRVGEVGDMDRYLIRLPGVSAFAFEPSIAVDTHGTVGVTWYDLRNDRPGDAALTADVWFAHSDDRGASWRQTHVAGPTDLRTAPLPAHNYVGEYQGLAALPGRGFAGPLHLDHPPRGCQPSHAGDRRLSAHRAGARSGDEAVPEEALLRHQLHPLHPGGGTPGEGIEGLDNPDSSITGWARPITLGRAAPTAHANPERGHAQRSSRSRRRASATRPGGRPYQATLIARADRPPLLGQMGQVIAMAEVALALTVVVSGLWSGLLLMLTNVLHPMYRALITWAAFALFCSP